jgi:glutaredoxin
MPRVTTSLPIPDVLTVYGASWCADCRNAQRYLDAVGAVYRYVDLGADRDAQAMLAAAGHLAIPVVVTTDGTVLIEPTAQELARVIGLPGAA